MEPTLFHGKLETTNRIIYTPSIFAKTNLIYLQEIGELQAIKPHISKRSNLASYLFLIVISGSGTLEYNGTTHNLSKGDCAFLDCKKAYSHCTSENLWKLKWVHFYGSNMNGIYEKYAERGGTVCFHSQNYEQYCDLLDELFQIASSSLYIRDMKLYEKFTSLLSFLMEESWNHGNHCLNSSKKRDLQDIKDYLDQHYQEKIILDQLANNFYINKFYLTRIFKEQFGISVTNYLLRVRITHAKQLLRFSNLSIEKIGQECGMNDANYFSRMFKKIEGSTPGEYRKKW